MTSTTVTVSVRRRLRAAALLASLLLASLVALPQPAEAAEPGTIAFASDRDGNAFFPDNWETYTINADGTGPTRLTNSPDVGDIEPAWFPDGASIAFTWREKIKFDEPPNSEIVRIDPAGGGTTFLTIFNNDHDAWHPAW